MDEMTKIVNQFASEINNARELLIERLLTLEGIDVKALKARVVNRQVDCVDFYNMLIEEYGYAIHINRKDNGVEHISLLKVVNSSRLKVGLHCTVVHMR